LIWLNRADSGALFLMNEPIKPAFTHCALHVEDMDASIAFYKDYCGLGVVRSHGATPQDRTVWIAEEGREREFVLVLVSGGKRQRRAEGDMTHYGFAVSSRDKVDAIAAQARKEGCLHWEPQDLPSPVGYLCAVEDPDGYIVEFSFGQPLGPGASAIE
jgi:catechol 2,3-dioxygenase-like lactoylglutathione lyase family enzyme